MDSVGDVVNRMVDNAISEGNRNEVVGEDDFYFDGLLYCGKCGMRKERYITLFNRVTKKVQVMCACAETKYYEDQKKQKEEEERRYLESLRINSLMDVRYEDATFEKAIIDSGNKTNMGLCQRYVDKFQEFYENNQGLIMYGDVGTGKSFAAACIANSLLGNGTSVVMTSFVKVLELIGSRTSDETEIISRINNAKLVIFDDLGAERKTDYALEKVFDIIDSRYRLKRPMIFTTNLDINDMAQEEDIRYKRIFDRIFEVCYPVEFKGGSWRKNGGKGKWDNLTGGIL